MARSRKAILDEIEKRIDAFDLLSMEEKEATKKKAREHVNAQRRQAQIDALFKQTVREAEVEHLPDEQLVDITVDLPPFAPMVRLDQIVYFHGCTYEVPMRQWNSMRDVIARAWEHQAEIEGKSRTSDATRRHMTTALSPSAPQGIVNATDNIRSV